MCRCLNRAKTLRPCNDNCALISISTWHICRDRFKISTAVKVDWQLIYLCSAAVIIRNKHCFRGKEFSLFFELVFSCFPCISPGTFRRRDKETQVRQMQRQFKGTGTRSLNSFQSSFPKIILLPTKGTLVSLLTANLIEWDNDDQTRHCNSQMHEQLLHKDRVPTCQNGQSIYKNLQIHYSH